MSRTLFGIWLPRSGDWMRYLHDAILAFESEEAAQTHAWVMHDRNGIKSFDELQEQGLAEVREL